MVVVPAGSFMMGSPEDEPEREYLQNGTESPQHTVTIAKPFAVTYQGRSGLIALLHRLGMEHRKPHAIPRKLDEAKQKVMLLILP